MNFLDIFRNDENSSLLNNPGDNFLAKITKTNRKVMKVDKPSEGVKLSETRYSSGTIVQTKSVKKSKE